MVLENILSDYYYVYNYVTKLLFDRNDNRYMSNILHTKASITRS